MTVSPGFHEFVVDQLGRATADVRTKKMFGGVGIYAGELFFALIDDDTLYFKVDDSNRGDFAARGMGPFRPFGEHGEVMQYYAVPADLLEDAEVLRVWVDKALTVARQKKKRPSKRKAK